LTKHGILHRKSCPHTSQQNGLAERKLRHILETGLTLLAHSHLSNRYWVDAFLTAVHIINRLPTPTLKYKSPYFTLHNREPDYQTLRVFGCLCYPLLRLFGLHKLEYRSKPCIFLGYNYAGYKCLDPVTNKVYLSRHVIFNEDFFPAKDKATSQLPSKISAQRDVPFILPIQLPFVPHDFSGLPPVFDHTTGPSAPSQLVAEPTSEIASLLTAEPTSPHTTVSATSPSNAASPQASTSLPLTHTQPQPHPMVTRSKTSSLRPKSFADFQLFHTLHSETKPVSYSKAALDPHWKEAMKLEYEALISNGTWTLCPRPLDHTTICNKWVYKIKRLADGSVEMFKARLVAKGFDQQSGIDYTETFNPVIKPSTIRVILTLAVHFNCDIRQLDVSNAFLQGSLLEEVYMERP
jgi:hypothetical protein